MTATRELVAGNRMMIATIAEWISADASDESLRALDELPDDIKIEILQQYFHHATVGSHTATYDSDLVALLLRRWYRIHGVAGPDLSAREAGLPGRDAEKVYAVDFGDTSVYMYMSPEKEASARRLVHTVANQAVLTTDQTSPPCELAEFVPLWSRERDRRWEDYYLPNSTSVHPIADYFEQERAVVADALGVRIRHPSTELALIANGDALRFHRDRLVNQYRDLAGYGDPPDTWRVVQDLTLVDWDMQPGTISGTVLEHPNGDRYAFVLRPSEVVGLFFVERPRLPGPMMMPYHCALPVFDQEAARTVGPAKGKRLSALTRGLALREETAHLAERAVALSVDEVRRTDLDRRAYASGVEVRRVPDLPGTDIEAVRLVSATAEGLAAFELSASANADLLRMVSGDPWARDYRLLRVHKLGEGFSDVACVFPQLRDARRIFLVNRTAGGPQPAVSFPVAFDGTGRGVPWIQLLRLAIGDVVEVPPELIPTLRLTPTDHLLHRSAPLDSFYSLPTVHERLAVMLDIVYL